MLTNEVADDWRFNAHCAGWRSAATWRAPEANNSNKNSIASYWATRICITAVLSIQYCCAEHLRRNDAPKRIALRLVEDRLRNLLEVDWKHVIFVQAPSRGYSVRSSHANTATCCITV